MVGSWEFLLNWISSVSCYDRPTASSKVDSKPYQIHVKRGQIIGDILYPCGGRSAVRGGRSARKTPLIPQQGLIEYLVHISSPIHISHMPTQWKTFGLTTKKKEVIQSHVDIIILDETMPSNIDDQWSCKHHWYTACNRFNNKTF